MIAVSFKEETHILDGPTGTEAEPLPVWLGNDVNGNKCFISCWKMTAEEYQTFLRTGRIYVQIYMNQQPVMSVHAKSPFIANDPEKEHGA